MKNTTPKLPSYLDNEDDITTLLNTAKNQVRQRYPEFLPNSDDTPLFVFWNDNIEGVLLSDGYTHDVMSYVYRGEIGILVFTEGFISDDEFYRVDPSAKVTRFEGEVAAEPAIKA